MRRALNTVMRIFAKMPDNVRPFFWPFTICHLDMVQLLHYHIFNAGNYPLCPLCNTHVRRRSQATALSYCRA